MKIAHVDEKNGVSFHTSPLSANDLRVLARIAVVLRREYLVTAEWEVTRRPGSLTLRSGKVVIKLFLDKERKLMPKVLQEVAPGLSNTVLGIELTHLNPYEREASRDYMKRCFGNGYADPRTSTEVAKVWITPQNGHIYDVAWFAEGPCEYEVTEEELDAFILGVQGVETE